MDHVYHIGEINKPWEDVEKTEWLSEQTVERSYQKLVLNQLEGLEQKFKISQYGELDYSEEGFCKYPLQMLKSKNWDENNRIVLITGGVHGYETSGVMGALKFAREKVHIYSSDFNFLIVPCVSPWSFETINRWNPHTIDVNRAFETGSECNEAHLLMNALSKYQNQISAHFDLHETTDSDVTEFRPALIAKNGFDKKPSKDIPDGFYVLGTHNNSDLDFQQAIITSVEKVTQIAPSDENGNLIGEKSTSKGVANIDTKKYKGVCFAQTGTKYAVTTEMYPGKNVNSEKCNNAQVAAVVGGIEWLLHNK
jgi:hypothetical protein